MMSQVAAVATASQGWMATSTPSAVATPLPPLKPRKIGYRWPRKAATATAASGPGGMPGASLTASQTANQPLAASPLSLIHI